MSFFRNNIISIIGLAITCGGILLHVGMTQAKFEALQAKVAKMEVEGSPYLQQRVLVLERDMTRLETESKDQTKLLSEVNTKLAVVVSWIEEQKRQAK